MRGTTKLWRSVATLSVIAVASIAVGCGSDSSSDTKSDTTKGTGIRAGTGSRTETSVAAGTAAGKAAGAPVALEAKTVGIINFLDGIESSDRLKTTQTLAITTLGWKSIQCDGKGTPTQFVACGNSLLDRGVDAIVVIAIEPGQIQSVLNKANAKKIPVVQVGGGSIPNGDLSGNYGPDETKSGQVLTDGIIAKLKGIDPASITIQDFPAAWGATRTKAFTAALKDPANSNIKIAANYQTDAANLVPFTQKAVADNLTKTPDLKAYWFTFDTTGQVGGQVIASKYPGKKFPDRPFVATFHADLGTLALMRKGQIDMTSDVNYDASNWIAGDQLAEYFARQTEISKENQPSYPGVGDLFTYELVTPEALPPAGEYTKPKTDVPAYFAAKWKQEFNK